MGEGDARRILLDLLQSWNSRYQWRIVDEKGATGSGATGSGPEFVFETQWQETNLVTPIADVIVTVRFVVTVLKAGSDGQRRGRVVFTVEHERLQQDAAALGAKNIDSLLRLMMRFKRRLQESIPIKLEDESFFRDRCEAEEEDDGGALFEGLLTEAQLLANLMKYFRKKRDRKTRTMSLKYLPGILMSKPIGFDKPTSDNIVWALGQAAREQPRGELNEEEYSEFADELVRAIVDDSKADDEPVDFEQSFAKAQGTTKDAIQARLKVAFEQMDVKQTGRLTKHQLITAVRSVPLEKPLDTSQIELLVKAAAGTRKDRVSYADLEEAWKELCLDAVINRVMRGDEVVTLLEKLLGPARASSSALVLSKAKKLLLNEKDLRLTPIAVGLLLGMRAGAYAKAEDKDNAGPVVPIAGLYERLALRIEVFRDRSMTSTGVDVSPTTPVLSVDLLSSSDQDEVKRVLSDKFDDFSDENGRLSTAAFKDMLLAMKTPLTLKNVQLLTAALDKNRDGSVDKPEFFEFAYPVVLALLRANSAESR